MNKLASALLLTGLLIACSTVPGTGRRTLNLVDLDTAMQLGEESYTEMTGSAPVITSGPDYEMVQRLGERIAAAAVRLYPDPSAQFEWEIKLIDEPNTANAWCLPGGKMAVYTGILPVTQTEEALAAVVGHEVAHAVARHGSERMSHGMVAQIVLSGTDLALGDMDGDQKALVMAALGAGANVGVMLPYSRAHESEADELGVYMSADAGYDPRAAIGLWERMGAMGGDKPPEFLSTHPSEESRIAHLEEVMPEALSIWEAAQDAGRGR